MSQPQHNTKNYIRFSAPIFYSKFRKISQNFNNRYSEIALEAFSNIDFGPIFYLSGLIHVFSAKHFKWLEFFVSCQMEIPPGLSFECECEFGWSGRFVLNFYKILQKFWSIQFQKWKYPISEMEVSNFRNGSIHLRTLKYPPAYIEVLEVWIDTS